MTRRHRATVVLAAGLLALPTVLAFYSGGFFAVPRLWAALAACALLLLGALVAPAPRTGPAWVAAVALAGLAGWVALSAGWAPLTGPAVGDAQRVALYAAAFAAGLLLLGAVPRGVEPALAAGCLVVVGYALSARLAPGLVEQTASNTAIGRLEQPLTYWNALGCLAAIGLVLSARLAGDQGRPAWLRAAGAASGVPLLLGVALTFSRGAILATAAGLVVLCWLAPDRAQLRALAYVLGAAVPSVVVAMALAGVRALGGPEEDKGWQGALTFAVLLASMAGAALLARRTPPPGRLRRAGPAGVAVAIALLAGAVGLAALAKPGTGTPETGATPARLVSADSNRFAYWKVALRDFADHPVRGAGSGAFRVRWRRERAFAESAVDAHSLYVETAAELGLVGLGLLGGFLGGVGLAARRALGTAPALVAGPAAALAVWVLHAAIDWDWEMPALTLVALMLAALLAATPRAPARGG